MAALVAVVAVAHITLLAVLEHLVKDLLVEVEIGAQFKPELVEVEVVLVL
jgi:hypothetical protein